MSQRLCDGESPDCANTLNARKNVSSRSIGTARAYSIGEGCYDVRNDDFKVTQNVAKEILGYFLNNPLAADDITGIARWRLMQQTVRHSVEQTSNAVEWLITEGYLAEERRGASGRIVHLNPLHRAAAEEYLRQQSGGKS